MIFRQLFDSTSCTYTYILARRPGAEALIIDPVLENVNQYLRLLEELNCGLIKAVDTHVHADHLTGLGDLRDKTKCVTVMGQESSADVVSMRVQDGDSIDIDGISLMVIHTPGHTKDSYSFCLDDRVFTGDTLLIRGTGRTDFQNGDPLEQYHSLFNKLLKLPPDMMVFPGHDYKGETVSTIGEEIAFNPRLQVGTPEEYIELMNSLNLPRPKMMDIALPANESIGLPQGENDNADWALSALDLIPLIYRPQVLLVDLREDSERKRDGIIPKSLNAPYTRLEKLLKQSGMLRQVLAQGYEEVIFYCSYGERSALAARAAAQAGLTGVKHLVGGLNAWSKSGGAVHYFIDD